jgi:hypothetical protein
VVAVHTQLELHDPAAALQIRQIIRRAVDQEGPVHRDVLLRRVRDAWGVARVGGRIRDNFDRTLEAAHHGGDVVVDAHGFVSLPGRVLETVRTPVEGTPETLRSVAEVPPAELRLAVLRLVEDALAIEDNELTAEAAGLFGWLRRGSDISAALDRAIAGLLDEGLLERRTDGTLTTTSQPAAELPGTSSDQATTNPIAATVSTPAPWTPHLTSTSAVPNSTPPSPARDKGVGEHSPVSFCTAVLEREYCPYPASQKKWFWFQVVRGWDQVGTWPAFYRHLDNHAQDGPPEAPRMCQRLRSVADQFRRNGRLPALDDA